ncbi:MAG: hypothetical protein E7270_01085 [Lachnospiraceae bacterium]|nr:hypothetical protein [Lachnospiraceae bacterium]
MSFIIAEHYYDILKNFTIDYTPTWGYIPLDEDRIVVDLDTREMFLPDSLTDFIAMTNDHRSQTVYFEVDRYFEDVDLAGLTCCVEYVTPEDKENKVESRFRLYPITLKSMIKQGTTEKLLLAWNLGSEATSQAGVLSFALHFFKVNFETESLAYSLYTKPCFGNILEGLEAITSDKAKEESLAYYEIEAEHFKILTAMIE